MKKVILSTIIISFNLSCGGGNDGGGTTTPSSVPSSVPAGIYRGTITPTGYEAEEGLALLTSNGNVALIDTDTMEGFIGKVSGISLTGSIYSTTTVPATGRVTTVSGNNIGGTYTSEIGGGKFALVADPVLYDRGSSLSKLVGTWVDSVFTSDVGISTWVIGADGTFNVTTTSGCNGTGAFTVFNTPKNEYNLNLTITDCAELNGTFTGFAVTSDTFNADDTISLVFSNGVVARFSEPIK
jgi:hypothetical protein